MTKVYVEARPSEWEFVCETDDVSAFTPSKGRFRFETVEAPVEADTNVVSPFPIETNDARTETP